MLVQTGLLGFRIQEDSGVGSSLRARHLRKPSRRVCPDKDLDTSGGLSESAYFILLHAAAGDGCINAMAGSLKL